LHPCPDAYPPNARSQDPQRASGPRRAFLAHTAWPTRSLGCIEALHQGCSCQTPLALPLSQSPAPAGHSPRCADAASRVSDHAAEIRAAWVASSPVAASIASATCLSRSARISATSATSSAAGVKLKSTANIALTIARPCQPPAGPSTYYRYPPAGFSAPTLPRRLNRLR